VTFSTSPVRCTDLTISLFVLHGLLVIADWSMGRRCFSVPHLLHSSDCSLPSFEGPHS
jgi:hypothetical protein